MLISGMPELQTSNDIFYLLGTLNLTEDKKEKQFQLILKETGNQVSTQLNFFFHNVAHKWLSLHYSLVTIILSYTGERHNKIYESQFFGAYLSLLYLKVCENEGSTTISISIDLEFLSLLYDGFYLMAPLSYHHHLNQFEFLFSLSLLFTTGFGEHAGLTILSFVL